MPHFATAASASISGVVFNDKNSDGVFNSGSESGVGGVLVTAYDSKGTIGGTSTTAGDGTYSIALSTSSAISMRVEFTTPDGYQSSFVGSSSGSSIQFVNLPATNVNFGVIRPGNFCADNAADPLIVTGCQRPGVATSAGSVNNVADKVTVGYTKWGSRPDFATVLTTKQTGAIWGVASQSSTGLVWLAAGLRSHSGLGPRGLGGLYVAHPDTGLVTSFDLSQYMTLSANNANYMDAARDITADRTLSWDLQGYSGIGKVGLGDIEFSPDGLWLYVVNLYERKLYRFPVAGTALNPTLGTPTSWTVADPGCANSNDVRPYALKTIGDNVFVGVVCSNETASAAAFTPSTPAGAATPSGSGYIRKFIPGSATWSTEATVSFSYQRAADFKCLANAVVTTAGCKNGLWHAWTDNFAAIKAATTSVPQYIVNANEKYWYAQPMIMGLDRTSDGSWIVGVGDRLSRQLGATNIDPTDTVNANNPNGTLGWVTAYTFGDTQLICNTGSLTSPTYVQESDGSCGSRSAAAQTNSGLANNSPYREFFFDSVDDPPSPDHLEISQGGVLSWSFGGTEQLAITAMDPGWAYNQNGLRWLNLNNGTMSSGTYFRGIFTEWPSGSPQQNFNSFGKSSGMADLEIVCDQAPIQIGNRVWIDTNKDGIQDPIEVAVGGVTVHLYDAQGTLVGTAITDTNGSYYFSSNVTEAAAGNGDNSGGGIVVGNSYTIRFDNPADYATGGPLAGLSLTTSTALSSATVLDSSVDSNATQVNGYPQISTPVMLPGINDHTFDVGFVVPLSVSVGDYVWFDKNKDGIQNSSEPGIAGVTLTITTATGQPVVNVLGQKVSTTVTDSSGHYSFDNLPPGQYKVTVTPPAGYTATKAGSGSNRSVDSSKSSATSVVLTTNGQRDPTLDFGFVNESGVLVYSASSVSVGNYVWRDLNGDGLQGPADKGIAGAVMTLTTVDGRPVTNILGKLVGPITTGPDGKYQFVNLPPGQYVVHIRYPNGFLPTTPNRNNRALNSSSFVSTSKSLAIGQSDMTLDFGVVGNRGTSLPATR